MRLRLSPALLFAWWYMLPPNFDQHQPWSVTHAFIVTTRQRPSWRQNTAIRLYSAGGLSFQSPRTAITTTTKKKGTGGRTTTTTTAMFSAAETDDTVPELPILMLYNSKSRTKEPLQTLQPNHVSMYTCGPTVYDYAHVGNFRAFLTYDLLKRVLIYFGYTVTHVCNLTDVDDKIIQRANEQQIVDITTLTSKYENAFFNDLNALNVIVANHYPRATEHIDDMMDMILTLAESDLAYETSDGSWYFATANQPGYGQQLVQLNKDEMEVTDRGENDMKRNVQDFALWKAYKPGVDRDDAAWERHGYIQKGRPGWHLECSAMARRYLGDTIDIHGGGIDLKFPHHENEIAQSEGVTKKTFCNCWVHNGFVNINDEKMSKSVGNFLTLRTACPHPQDVRSYRFLVISSQYSKPLNFTPQAMEAAKSALKRIDKVKDDIARVIGEAGESKSNNNNSNHHQTNSPIANTIVPKALANFETALLDDLSTPRACAALFSLIKAAENELKRSVQDGKDNDDDDDEEDDGDGATKALDILGLQRIGDALHQMDKVFGIFYQVPVTQDETDTTESADGTSNGVDGSTVPEEVIELVELRTQAKEAKDWELADSLRTRVMELGFAIQDVKGGNPVVTKVE